LNKLLFSELYKTTPRIDKRGGRKAAVGTVIFDPDGEYFWPDDKGRPGLCDVPALEDKLVVFTERKNPSRFYQSFVAGGVKLDIRRLRPGDVISIALDPERQEQQNVRKLRGLPQERWEKLVDLIDNTGNTTPLKDLYKLLDLTSNQEVEALAARGNMTTIVKMLHDKSSQLMDILIHSLSMGKLCVVDVSQMRGSQSLILSGLILRRIFDHNQREFTAAEPQTIPTIAVVEEAQSVLREKAAAAEPYITWVKEGRKYDLGALLITQQPGSIPVEILSQGDNWFVFHLLSVADLFSLKKANAHFSEDLLSSLLNEPIPGQGVFWSSVGGKPYPVSIRALLFENMFPLRDPKYNKRPGNTYRKTLTRVFPDMQKTETAKQAPNAGARLSADAADDDAPDVKAGIEKQAIDALRANANLMRKIAGEGAPWGGVMTFFLESLPQLDDRGQFAYHLVAKALNTIFGQQDEYWETFKHPQTGKTWVRKMGRRDRKPNAAR